MGERGTHPREGILNWCFSMFLACRQMDRLANSKIRLRLVIYKSATVSWLRNWLGWVVIQ